MIYTRKAVRRWAERTIKQRSNHEYGKSDWDRTGWWIYVTYTGKIVYMERVDG